MGRDAADGGTGGRARRPGMWGACALAAAALLLCPGGAAAARAAVDGPTASALAALTPGALEADASQTAAAGNLAAAARYWQRLVVIYARPANPGQANNEALFWRRLRAYDLSRGQTAQAAYAFQQELKYWRLAGQVGTEVYTLEEDAAASQKAGNMAEAVADWRQLVAIYAHPVNRNEADDEALWWEDLQHAARAQHDAAAQQQAFQRELHYFALAGHEDWVVWKLEQEATRDQAAHDLTGAVAAWRQLLPVYAHPANVNQANNEALFWRRMGHDLLAMGQTTAAAQAFNEEAAYWKLDDRAAWGNADQQLARSLAPVLDVYVRRSTAHTVPPRLGRFDPGFGTYVGFYVQGDPAIGNAVGRIPSVYGRKPAILLYYLDWGQELPAADVAAARQEGAALEIALQPQQGLAAVLQDRGTLTALVRQCAAAGVPIFLRFAGEMNGAWTAWGANPDPGNAAFAAHAAQYVAAFRLVATAMHAGAPNVAMVWSPNDMPQSGTEAYYPGNAYVDWVGVSAYLPHSLVGEPDVGVGQDWLAYLAWIVQHYGAVKPIMVAEGAVTHQDLITGADVTPWAVAQLTAFFAGLPRLFPQVRAVVYWSASDATSDYALGDDPAVARALDAATSSPWYLNAVGQVAPVRYQPLRPGMAPGAAGTTAHLSAYVQSVQPVAAVAYRLDGHLIGQAAQPPYRVALDLAGLAPGPHTLVAQALGPSGQIRMQWRDAFVLREAGAGTAPASSAAASAAAAPGPSGR
jgi:hypothetical protein